MKRKTLSLLTVLTASLFLAACDDRSDDQKAISKFKDLTPPRFSEVVNRKDDVRDECVVHSRQHHAAISRRYRSTHPGAFP